MRSLCGGAAVLAGMSLALGCTQWPQDWSGLGQKTSAQPAAQPKVETAAVNPAPTSTNGELAEIDDGATAQAVRDYISQLESATSGASVPGGADAGQPRKTRPATVAPKPSPVSTVTRANQALDIDAPAEPTESSRASPARETPRILAVSLVGTDTVETSAASQPAGGANQSADTAQPDRLDSLRRLIGEAQKNMEADPASIEKQWQLSLLQLAAGEYEQAASISAGLAREPGAVLERSVAAMAACGRWLLDPAAAADGPLPAVDSLREHLQVSAELVVPIVALCTRVTAFGVYEEFPVQALVPNQANRVIVYWEVGNFRSEQDESGRYRTLLSGRLELFTPDGRSLWTHQEDKIEDLSRRMRHDFFMAKLVTLPPSLGPGEYLLKVTVTDQLAAKTNEAVHRFVMGENAAATADTASASVR